MSSTTEKLAGLDENEEENKKVQRYTAATFLFNSIVMISGLSPLYFPEDQQKEARVLIKDIKEKLRRLRSMLGVPK